jgi:hypothetical protein
VSYGSTSSPNTIAASATPTVDVAFEHAALQGGQTIRTPSHEVLRAHDVEAPVATAVLTLRRGTRMIQLKVRKIGNSLGVVLPKEVVQALRATEGEIKADVLANKDYVVIPVGRKAEGYFRFRGYKIGKFFGGFSDAPSYADAKAIGEHVVDLFIRGEVDRVELIYTRFISAGSQEVVRRPLVPLERGVVEGGDGKAGTTGSEYEFEPTPETILDTLLPRYVEARVYAALLNAAASEHAFRQRAMKSATDNAEELIKNLSRIMNRARQDSITTEIMEIVSGAEALGSRK